MQGEPLDGLVERLLALSPFDYRVAADEADRVAAFRLRGLTVVERGWCTADDLPDGQERDGYDERAIHVLGWAGDVPMCTGRVVLPPGLPTEEECGITVQPRGGVVDVGRMCVAPSHQSRQHAAFVGLMCRLYVEMRANGFAVACGMMSPAARGLVRNLGLRLEILGPERVYWNEERSPVRFSLLSTAEGLAMTPAES